MNANVQNQGQTKENIVLTSQELRVIAMMKVFMMSEPMKQGRLPPFHVVERFGATALSTTLLMNIMATQNSKTTGLNYKLKIYMPIILMNLWIMKMAGDQSTMIKDI